MRRQGLRCVMRGRVVRAAISDSKVAQLRLVASRVGRNSKSLAATLVAQVQPQCVKFDAFSSFDEPLWHIAKGYLFYNSSSGEAISMLPIFNNEKRT